MTMLSCFLAAVVFAGWRPAVSGVARRVVFGKKRDSVRFQLDMSGGGALASSRHRSNGGGRLILSWSGGWIGACATACVFRGLGWNCGTHSCRAFAENVKSPCGTFLLLFEGPGLVGSVFSPSANSVDMSRQRSSALALTFTRFFSCRCLASLSLLLFSLDFARPRLSSVGERARSNVRLLR
jgi:hypothetical protein